ncbi:MAG TPA: magnesium/cobalt transporter CorA [Vicinamibacterales bacterium]
MLTILVHRDGRIEQVDRIDPSWLTPGSGVVVWADFAAPDDAEFDQLAGVFGFHPVAVDSARAATAYPKAEVYDGYLYAVLHGIHFEKSREAFATHDTDFFLRPGLLVTVHDGRTRSIPSVQELCRRNPQLLAEGPAALMHRIVDEMVDHYGPEVAELESWLDELEEEVFERPRPEIVRELLQVKRDISALRRIALPQRDVVNRLARREFPVVDQEVAYRFRDVYDHLARIADEALIFQERVNSLLDAHLSNMSNQLNAVMKVLTVITVIFLPLTLVTGLYGMNMRLPLVGSEQDPRPFWWLLSAMIGLVIVMLALFRLRRWI